MQKERLSLFWKTAGEEKKGDDCSENQANAQRTWAQNCWRMAVAHADSANTTGQRVDTTVSRQCTVEVISRRQAEG